MPQGSISVTSRPLAGSATHPTLALALTLTLTLPSTLGLTLNRHAQNYRFGALRAWSRQPPDSDQLGAVISWVLSSGLSMQSTHMSARPRFNPNPIPSPSPSPNPSPNPSPSPSPTPTPTPSPTPEQAAPFAGVFLLCAACFGLVLAVLL